VVGSCGLVLRIIGVIASYIAMPLLLLADAIFLTKLWLTNQHLLNPDNETLRDLVEWKQV
jgi:hypothetical protein